MAQAALKRDLTEMGALEVALAYRAFMSGVQLVVVDPKRSQPPTLDPQVRRRIVEAAGLDQSPATTPKEG